MSKTSNTLMMLEILNSRNIVKIQELADALETNPRNILEYKKELEYCGYYIDSIPGKYGGYRLDKERILPSINLTDEEKQVLISANTYLMSRDDFLLKDTYSKVMGKIAGSIKVPEYNTEYKIISRFPIKMKEIDLKNRFKILQHCITNHTKIQLVYRSQKNKDFTYIYHPYDLFMYNNSWFVIGWNELYNDVNYLKINRIQQFFKLNEKFTTYKYYDLHNYVDEFGFKNNRVWYPIKFMATGKLAGIVKERIYGRNQKVTEIDIEHTIIETEMESEAEAKSFILGHIDQIEVLSPDSLKKDLVDIANNMLRKYEDKE